MFLLFRDNPVQTEYLRRGIALLHDFQYEPAIENLKIAVQKENTFSDLARKYLAKAYEKKGLLEEVEQIVVKSPVGGLHGGFPICLDTEYNQIVRDVAQEYELEVIDAASVLDSTPSDYLDFCHPDANGHRNIAHLICERLSEFYAWR